MSIAYLVLPQPINHDAVAALPGAAVVRSVTGDRWSVGRIVTGLRTLVHRPVVTAARPTRLARLTEQPG